MSCYSARGQRIWERRNSQITLWRLFTTPLSDLRDRNTLIADVMGEFGAVRLKQHPPRSCVSVVSNSCFKCQHQTWSRWFLCFFSSGDVSLTCGPGRPIPGTPTSPYRRQSTLTVNQSSIFIYKHDNIINGNSHLDSFGTDGALHTRQTWLSLKWQKKTKNKKKLIMCNSHSTELKVYPLINKCLYIFARLSFSWGAGVSFLSFGSWHSYTVTHHSTSRRAAGTRIPL